MLKSTSGPNGKGLAMSPFVLPREFLRVIETSPITIQSLHWMVRKSMNRVKRKSILPTDKNKIAKFIDKTTKDCDTRSFVGCPV